MTDFRKANLIIGWLIFFIATTVYYLTVEPTVSFWDCGEFIAAAYKMLVGHPPGAPFFLVLGRFFSMFAPDVSKVAFCVNLISVLASGFTVLFLFWTITHLAKKIIAEKDEKLTSSQLIAVMGSAVVGSLAYTFSDTAWFSAVEGEVYALSSMFTAVVFWAILKWESEADKDVYADRWVILIAYLIGLSIGVHLLNLLAIPAIALVYYFKKFTVSKLGVLKTLLISFVILGFIQYGIIPGIPHWGAQCDLFFVNVLNLPFWSGFFFFSIIIVGLLTFGIYYSHKNKKYILNKALLCFTFIVLGYTSYSIIVIRSNANPPMDENDPADPFALVSYLNREQYGDRPLIKGQYFTARVIGQEQGSMRYVKGKTKYEEAGRKLEYVFESNHTTIFPRCYNSLDENHKSFYRDWLDLPKGKKPSFADNIHFLLSYQVGHMYFRYFMWNYAGRQNDIQGHGNLTDGNWISGIKFIDDQRLGDQGQLPEEYKNNKARNTYFFLPLILGLLGLFYQYNKNKKDMAVVTFLFFFTGLAIVLYLNQTPLQPRERDYAYAASFYAFAIWIGLGVLALYDAVKEKLSENVSASVVTIVCLIAVPLLLYAQNWDDHDRSRRYTARDSAYNYLNSCAPNAVVFTNGDNDTFPLWYIQEVEGVRRDVRVINLSLLSTDWYIDQMKRKAYESDPVPFSLTKEQYIQGKRDYVPFYDRKIPGYSDLKEVMEFMKSDNPQTKARTQSGELVDYYPTKKFRIPVDIDKVIANGTVRPEDRDKVVPFIEWEIKKDGLYKSDMMILDLLAYNNWERPIYFAITVSSGSYMNLQEYFQLEGLAYRLVPIKSSTQGGMVEKVATETMYENLIKKFKWGGMSIPDIYLDENNLRMCSNFRHNFIRLSESLLAKGDKKRTLEVLDRCLKEMPDTNVPYNIFIIRIIDLYYQVGAPQKAEPIIKRLADITEDKIKYHLSLKNPNLKEEDSEFRQSLAVIQELNRLASIHKQESIQKYIREKIEGLKLANITG